MTKQRFIGVMLAGLLVMGLFAMPDPVNAQGSSSAALAGQVSSQEEGNMEGVLVTVRRDGAKFTVTVVSDAQGRYSFPANRLEPGQYSVAIRAAGYELPSAASVC